MEIERAKARIKDNMNAINNTKPVQSGLKSPAEKEKTYTVGDLKRETEKLFDQDTVAQKLPSAAKDKLARLLVELAMKGKL